MGASRRVLDIRARPVGPVSNKVMENPIVIASRGKVTLGRETEDVKVDIDLGKEGRANKISRRQVTLGRGTENVKVDIDLGKEGRANKISHRQAVIKTDEAGSFHMKNIGKCQIFVDSKEIPRCKRINLSSDSLIEESGPPVKTIASSTRNDGTPNVPHPVTEIVQTELIDTKNIMNARFVEDWLVQRENESDEEYFQTMATLAEVNFWERMRAEQNNAALQQGQQNVFIAVDSIVSRTALRMLQCQMRQSGFELEMIQLIWLSMKGVSVLIQFLCYNCLHNSNAQADKVALKLLGAATTVATNTRMMSDLPGFIAILVLRSYTGNDDSQTLCLELLVVLSRLYCNKVRIISMAGFYSALWHLLHGSEHKGKIACRLIESLMDTEEGKIKFIKDRAAYHLIRFTIASGAVTPWIGGVVQGLRDFSLGQTRLLDALADLPVGHFVRQRLMWCLLDSVEEDEKYRFDDKFED